MSKRTIIGFTILFVLSLGMGTGAPPQDIADMALVNGKVVTLDPKNPAAEAVAVKGGRILAAGSSAEIRKYVGPATQVLDARGKLVIPGLIDAHLHFAGGGRSLASLTFRGVSSVEKVLEMVATRIKELPAGETVNGGEYDHTLFPGQKWPSKEDLDTVAPNNAVVIRRVDGHSIWVNSEALRQSGITKDTKSPFGGEIAKDPATGEPTGIFKEAATGLLKVKRSSKPSSIKDDIERGLAYAATLGLTGIQTSASLQELEIFKQLKADGKLTLRVYAWLPIDDLDRYIKLGIKQGQGDDMVRVGFQKVFIDGTLGSGTALMFEPFADDPAKIGLPQYKEDAFYTLIEKAHQNGYQTGTHAIGDKGVNWALNAIERAQKKFGAKDLRHRIEHAQIIIPSDVKRFKQLGVIASMQPTHCMTDMRFCEIRVGRERSKNAYIWKTLLDAGAQIAFGTDWPVEPLDPMRGLYSAVTRKNIESGGPEGGWFPKQRLTMADSVRLYTLGAAYASFEEKIKGSIEPGKLADFTVLSKDIYRVDPKEVLTTEALYTILGGKIVFQK
jgi:predicted amidohydrolase YtcJ